MKNFAADPNERSQADIAKAMLDLDDLLRLLNQGLSRTKPWQRQLGDQLAKIDKQVLVLRLTIAMGREDGEVLSAAEALRATCRGTAKAISATRADVTTRLALKLLVDLAERVR